MARSSVFLRTLGRGLLLAGAALASLSAQAVEWKPGHSYWADRAGNIFEFKGPGITPSGGIGASAPTITGSAAGVTVKTTANLPLASGRSAAVEVIKHLPWSSMASAMRAVGRVAGPYAIAAEGLAWLAESQISAQPCTDLSTSCDGLTQWQKRSDVEMSPTARLLFGGANGREITGEQACREATPQGLDFVSAVLDGSQSGGGYAVYKCMVAYRPPNPTTPFQNGTQNGRYYCPGGVPATVTGGKITCPNDPPRVVWEDVRWQDVEPQLSPGPSSPEQRGPALWPGLLPWGIPDTSSPPTVQGPTWVSGPTSTSTDAQGNTRTRTTGWDLGYEPGKVVVRERTVDGDGSSEEKPYESPSEAQEHFCKLYPDSAMCKPAQGFEDKNDVQEFCNNNPTASMCKPFPSQDPASAPTPADPASSPTDCDKNPDALGCIDAGDPPEDEDIPKSEQSVTLEQESFAVGGGCPPPQTFSAGRFGSFEMRYDLACQGFTWLAPVVKALGAFAAAMICLAALRQGA